MGNLCNDGGSSETKATKKIDNELDMFEDDDKIIHKLLLLGPGESGKSTLLKQMRKIHGHEFSEDEKLEIKQPVYKAIHVSIKSLCDNSKNLSQMGKNTKVSSDIAEICENISNGTFTPRNKSELTKNELEMYKRIWNDEGIKNTLYNHSHEFQIYDNIDYIFNKMELFQKEEYIPTFEDLIHFRKRTTGVNKIEFETSNDNNSKKERMLIYDVGGQRNERRKWYNLFDNVAAVLFVVSLSGFNQMLWEDNRVNRMAEALTLFEETINRDEFKKAHCIMFFNKYDLFIKKIAKFKISDYFDDYKGKENNEQEIINWLQNKFKLLCIDKEKAIHFHTTCATDQSSVKKMFHFVNKIVLKNNFTEVGFM